jgi:ABC-type transport system involved in multi-copper enzyme maturation permease subunit
MNGAIVWRLITKDLYLYRWLIAGSLAAGLLSLVIAGINDMSGNIGFILLLTSIVALGVFIAIYGILTERKEKTLLFVLSLPISTKQYATSKVAASLIAFLVPWVILTVMIVTLTLAFDPPLDGRLPFTTAMMLFFLANFCVLVALVLSTASEFWAVAGIVVTNLAVSVYLTTVTKLPGIQEHIEGPVAVWSPTILTIIAVEAAVIVISLWLTLFVHSRKKDFI